MKTALQRSHWFWAACGAAILCCAAILLLSLRIGPAFEGRPLRYWVWDLRSSRDEQRQQAEAFFKRSGESTAIALSLMVRRRDPFWQWLRDHPKSLRFLPEGLKARVYDHAFERLNAITACEHMKAKSRPALPAIMASASDHNVFLRQTVASALGTLRYEPDLTIPVLITMLRDSEPWVRKNAAYSLAFYGEEARSAVPALSKAVKDSNRAVATEAEFALSVITQPEKFEIGENGLQSR